MLELRWIYVKSPKPGDVSVGYTTWQRLQFRQRVELDWNPATPEDNWSQWQDVPMAAHPVKE